jgi:hypothetical protein
VAWTFISSASNLCLTLGYHIAPSAKRNDQSLQADEESLFWLVYSLDKGLSLRLGRSSNIRDRDITLPAAPNEPRRTRLARIQGKVYDQLYNSEGLSKPEYERGKIAESLARELREVINDIYVDVMVCIFSFTRGLIS